MATQKCLARVVAVVGIGIAILASPVQGQECPEYVGELSEGLWENAPDRIEVSGPFAYLGSPVRCFLPGCYRSTVHVADLSDPGGPRVVGVIEVGTLLDFTISNDRLYHHSAFSRTATFDEYLGIIDVSNPSRPVPLLSRHEIDGLREIAVSGDTVFNATSTGLLVLDASDPSNPIDLGFLASPWRPSDLVVEGDFAYVSVPESGLSVIDVSDSANPVGVGTWATIWEALDLEVQDGFAYVADGTGGLKVIDVTDPTAPAEVATLETALEALKVSVAGSHAAVVLGDSGVLIVDVSNPGSPVEVGVVATEGPPLAATMWGSTVYISEGNESHPDLPDFEGVFTDGRFSVVDLTRPTFPVEVASFRYRSTAMDVNIADSVIYIASGDTGLLVLDQSNPEDPLVEFLDTPGFALGVTKHGDLALVADDHKGVRIIDVSDPENLSEVGFVDTPGQARRVVAAGDHAYVADGDSGVRIIDISIPESPVELGAIDTPGPAVDVVVDGAYAYVADGQLHVFDVSDPIHPAKVGPYGVVPALAIAIEDEVLYLANTGLSVYSLTEPRSPGLLAGSGQFPTWREPTSITLSGDHAYVTTRVNKPPDEGGRRFWMIWSSVEIFEIQDLYFPSWVDRWEAHLIDHWAATVSNGRIFLAVGEPEIVVLDIRCLTTYWVGVVAHNNGVTDSQWRSDVIISSEADHNVDIEFILHTEHEDLTTEGTIGPRSQGVFEDIVGLLSYEGKGALEIQAQVPVNVISRIYNETDSGTSGAYFAGHRVSDCLKSGEIARLYGLRQQEGGYRTNINITNTGLDLGYVWITLHRSDGRELIGYVVYVDPGMVVQDLQPFKKRAGRPNLGWGFASVRAEGSSMLVSATVIDSQTNHPMMVPMTR